MYGMEGPITVKGKVYTPPDVVDIMPGLIANKGINNSRIAQLLSYIRNAWGNNSGEVTPEDIGAVKYKNKERNRPFVEQDLRKSNNK